LLSGVVVRRTDDLDGIRRKLPPSGLCIGTTIDDGISSECYYGKDEQQPDHSLSSLTMPTGELGRVFRFGPDGLAERLEFRHGSARRAHAFTPATSLLRRAASPAKSLPPGRAPLAVRASCDVGLDQRWWWPGAKDCLSALTRHVHFAQLRVAKHGVGRPVRSSTAEKHTGRPDEQEREPYARIADH